MPATALDHYVTLGRSGLRVSPLCLGTMTFGLEWGWGSTPEESTLILDAYIDAGGNFVDTANIYTRGHSEKIIGDHVGRHPAKRDRLVIATKFFGNLHSGDPNAGGGHRKSMTAACEHSLRRLQTDSIDLYWLHAWDRFTPIEETMRSLDDLVRAGKVRYVGFSDTPAWIAAKAQMLARRFGWSPLIALQIEYSLLERTVEGELVPMALDLGLGITPWSPLAGGALSGKYTRENAGKANVGRGEWVANRLNEKGYAVVDRLTAIGKEVGATPAQVALAWLQAKPGVVSSIIGARTIDQLKDNLAALRADLNPSHIASLDDLSKPQLNFPHDFLIRTASVMQGGTTINGRSSEPWPLAPKSDAERY